MALNRKHTSGGKSGLREIAAAELRKEKQKRLGEGALVLVLV